MEEKRSFHQRRRGGVLIGALCLVLVLSVVIGSVGKLAVSHTNRAYSDAWHSAALAVAEAGLNSEIRSLTQGNSAHEAASPGTGTLGTGDWAGSYSVTCAQVGGAAISNPASPPSTIWITSVGTVGGISRSIRISATGGSGSFDYGVYSKTSGVINGNQDINGSVGTGGTVTVNGNANLISDNVIGLHGDAATATINPTGTFQTEHRDPIDWPTTAEKATELFPSGGLTYLSTNNDNNLASAYVNNGTYNGAPKNNQTVTPAIAAGNSISANGKGTLTLYGKAGGANYYLNNMTFNGQWTIHLDNSAGPVNIWCVNTTTTAKSFTFNGGTASVSMSTDPSKAVKLYLADYCNLTLNGNGEGRFGVYGINDSTTGGIVTFNGNNNLYGSVITNKYTFNGTNAINYTSGYFSAGTSTWQFGGYWQESAPR